MNLKKPLFVGALVALMASAPGLAACSVTFNVTFDHWSYSVTGDTNEVHITTTTGTSPSFQADLGALAYPEGGDNPASGSASALVSVYAVFHITASKTTGDPYDGSTYLNYEQGLSMSSFASCSNNSSAKATITGTATSTVSGTITSYVTNHDTNSNTFGPNWGSPGAQHVNLTATSATSYDGYLTVGAGTLSIEVEDSAPAMSYNEAQSDALGILMFRNVYATTTP